MKKMMLTAIVSLFAACGGAPVEENTAESQEALNQGQCELGVVGNGGGTLNGYCTVASSCARGLSTKSCPPGTYAALQSVHCGRNLSSRGCSF